MTGRSGIQCSTPTSPDSPRGVSPPAARHKLYSNNDLIGPWGHVTITLMSHDNLVALMSHDNLVTLMSHDACPAPYSTFCIQTVPPPFRPSPRHLVGSSTVSGEDWDVRTGKASACPAHRVCMCGETHV